MNSIEQAAKKYYDEHKQFGDEYEAFKAGAKWQQSQQPIEWENKFAELRAGHVMEVQGFLELNRKLGEEIAELNKKGNGSDTVKKAVKISSKRKGTNRDICNRCGEEYDDMLGIGCCGKCFGSTKK